MTYQKYHLSVNVWLMVIGSTQQFEVICHFPYFGGDYCYTIGQNKACDFHNLLWNARGSFCSKRLAKPVSGLGIVSNYTQFKQYDVITHPCPNFDRLVKPPCTRDHIRQKSTDVITHPFYLIFKDDCEGLPKYLRFCDYFPWLSCLLWGLPWSEWQ